jgi:hypothetical protein
MPKSSIELKKLIYDAKNYGMKLTGTKTNPATGYPINIYEGGRGNLMMQITGNENNLLVTLYGMN